jgi:hypothetical protein
MSKYSNFKYLIQRAQCIFCIVRRRASGSEYKCPRKLNVYLADCLWFMCECQHQVSALPTVVTGRLTPPIAEEKAPFKIYERSCEKMHSDGAWNQNWLCWRRPAVSYYSSTCSRQTILNLNSEIGPHCQWLVESTKAEESPLLLAATKKRIVKS